MAADAVRRAVMARRTAFRFCAVYIVLYSFATQIAGGLILFPNFSLPSLGTRWPMRAITEWLAVHLFRMRTPLVYSGNSGDTAFHWIQTFWLLVVSVIVSLAWTRLDRRRGGDVELHKWLRLFVRFALAAQMFYFGMAKVIPTQFPPPSLVTLVQPLGHLSRTDLLWTFIGSSTGYQMFTGWAEMLAGVLLIVPQTTLLGALIAFADMIQVFVLNMTYDVGLKQIALHLVLLSVFLMAPDASRLADVLLRDRPAGASPNPPLFHSDRANRRALVVQLVFGLYLAAMFTRLAFGFWSGPCGPGSPRSVLYGICDVDRLSVDGQARPPVLNDYDRRWRRVIFDAPNVVVVQRTDDSFAHYGASIEIEHRSIVLRKGNGTVWRTVFRFERPRSDRLVLDGEMDGHEIHAELDLLGFDTLRLLNSSFRWIRPPDPYGG